jgi:hypothetical protein
MRDWEKGISKMKLNLRSLCLGVIILSEYITIP